MERARPTLRPPDFDDLLYAAIDAPEDQVDALLEQCPDPELQAAVRRLLAVERAAGAVASPARIRLGQHRPAQEGDPPGTGLGSTDPEGSPAADRRRLWRVARIAS
ncbi:MAG: hypothetical protein MI919_28555, partial [Holophagales bacterium]|nr:hypothetical protein [Holophagales bacterium]